MIRQSLHFTMGFSTLFLAGIQPASAASTLNLADKPLYITASEAPLNMLIMGRDHKLYYEAYNDASDLNGDGIIDRGYQGYHTKPDLDRNIDYYGYFNSYACYKYEGGRFVPTSVKSAEQIALKNKTCARSASTGMSSEWSGDFLNYVTTARIDALRKVLYGGTRSTDTAGLTVLERTHIPQDAHAWGKEYRSVAVSGFDISDYAPLSLPKGDSRHLFANVSLSNTGEPLLRVLNDSSHRVWEWVSKEAPVAGDSCINGLNGPTVNCVKAASTGSWSVVPTANFAGLTRSTFSLPNVPHPANKSAFDNLEATYKTADGTDSPGNIDGSGNPHGGDDHYMSIFKGEIEVPETGIWEFAVDGDDAVEFSVRNTVVASWYDGHGACNCNTYKGSIALTAGKHQIKFRHEEGNGGDSYKLLWRKPVFKSEITNFTVRAEVCKTGVTGGSGTAQLSDTNCRTYGSSNKPIGVLHEFGENDSMLFGLISGSYVKNLDGGVLRKKISSFRNEINQTNGTFSNPPAGIVKTIDKFRIVNYNYNNRQYGSSVSGGACGWITNRALKVGECEMWGNPVAEMMYESLRYFAGKSEPLSDFAIAKTGNSDAGLGLPLDSWNDPYDKSSGGANECAKPFQMIISDINPSYDSDKVPGSVFNPGYGSGAAHIAGLNVATLADTVTANEADVKGLKYIGEVSGVTPDSAPTPKTVASLASIRGLSPEEPTKQGSYYSASLAYYGHQNDINKKITAPGEQRLQTFAVALASPLPRIEIPMAGGKLITIVPFAKSVKGPPGYDISPTASFQPTNQIVDFYVQDLTQTSGSFLINYEDVEQGADHDMDAISRYDYKVNSADNTVTVTVTSEYASGGIDQHMGYVISGTNGQDGVYLEVKDKDAGSVKYFLDTPADRADPGKPRGNSFLGFVNTRTFSPGDKVGAGVLKGPLWYAAKWGGFTDANNDGIPSGTEWDADGDGDPDNYFLVTNALKLAGQLRSAFTAILAKTGSSASAAVNRGSLNTESLLYEVVFDARDWSGQIVARKLNEADGTRGAEEWNAEQRLAGQISAGHATNRQIITYNPETSKGVQFKWPSDYTNPPATNSISQFQAEALLLGQTTDRQSYGADLLAYLRGAKDEEQGAGGATRDFRKRTKSLGDIVNSNPLYISRPSAFYPDVWPEGTPEKGGVRSYKEFRIANKNRTPMLAVGANDGMLHIFDAGSKTQSTANFGKEMLAYVPSKMFAGLSDLASTNYSHRYYVDGDVYTADAFFGGIGTRDWRTTLVGGLGAGGQTIYALDVTDPSTFTEGQANKVVLWEFTDADDVDLGYTFGKPVVQRMANGKWAAIFGNGYNNTKADGLASATGNSVLYVVDIETGAIIRKFDTKQGMVQDPKEDGTPNGMSAPLTVDLNRDSVVDAIYAGDLFGNLWKIDVSSTNAASWDFAYKTGDDPAPLFVTTDAAGIRLPITTKPSVGGHPVPEFFARGDTMVFIGTGKYIETSDTAVVDQSTQSLFGVWDDQSGTVPRSGLLQQNILDEFYITRDAAGKLVYNDDDPGTEGAERDRQISSNPIRWRDEVGAGGTVLSKHRGWVLDLYNSEDGNLANFGERQVSDSNLTSDRLLFTTIIPSDDPCALGGRSWFMAVDPVTGGALSKTLFDSNNDGVIDENDKIDIDGDGVGDLNSSGVGVDGQMSGATLVGGGDNGGSGSGVDSVFGQDYEDKIDSFSKSGSRRVWREVYE